MAGGQLQGDHGHGKGEACHGYHGARDGGEHGAGAFRPEAVEPAELADQLVVDAGVYRQYQERRQDGGERHYCGEKPKADA